MLSEIKILNSKIKDTSENYSLESSNNSPHFNFCQFMLKQPLLILKKLPHTILLNGSYNINENQINYQRTDPLTDFKQENNKYDSVTALFGGLNLENNNEDDGPILGVSNHKPCKNTEVSQCNKNKNQSIQNKPTFEFDTLRDSGDSDIRMLTSTNTDLNLFYNSQNENDKTLHINDEIYKSILKKKISRMKTDKRTKKSSKISQKTKMDINISKVINDNSIFYKLAKKIKKHSPLILQSKNYLSDIFKLKNDQKLKSVIENEENKQTLINESKNDQNIDSYRVSEIHDIIPSGTQNELTGIVSVSNTNSSVTKCLTDNYNNPLKKRIKCYETDELKCSNLFQNRCPTLQEIENRTPPDSPIIPSGSQQDKYQVQTIDESDSLMFKKDNHLAKLITDFEKNVEKDVDDPDSFKLKIDIDEANLTSPHSPKNKKIHHKKLLKKNSLMQSKKSLKMEKKLKTKPQQIKQGQSSKKQTGCGEKQAKLKKKNLINTQFSSNVELNGEEQEDNVTKGINLIENSKTKSENKCPKHWMTFKLKVQRKKGLHEKKKSYLSSEVDLKNKKWHKSKGTVQRNNGAKRRSCLTGKKFDKRRKRRKKKANNEDDVKINSESDNEKRITMEFPKHNWLQNKWEKNGCLGSCDPIEKTQNDCGFNMNFYCDQSRLHWRFSHDLNMSNIKRKDRKTNDDDVKDNNDDMNTIPDSCGISHPKNIKPDNSRKDLKLCFHCLTSCNQASRNVNSLSTSNSPTENIPETHDKTNETLKKNINSEVIDNNDKINTHSIHSSPEKLGFGSLKKQSNAPVQMVFPQIKTPLVSENIQDDDETRQNLLNIDNYKSQQASEKITRIQANLNIPSESITDSPVSYGSETISNESPLSMYEGQYSEMNSSPMTSMQATSQKITDEHNSNSETIPNNLQIFAKQQNITTEADISIGIPKEPDHSTRCNSVSFAPINPQLQNINCFPDNRNINILANNYSNSSLPKPISASSHDSTSPISNLEINESTHILDSQKVIPDQSVFQNSGFRSPLEMTNFQTSFYQRRPQDTLIKKPIPLRAQEIASFNSFVYNDHIRQTSHINLESRQNSINYTQRQQFIKTELERQKRELQQIEYIMSKKAKECEELLKLKCSKGQLLKKIEYEQKLLLECQQQSYIPAKNCMSTVRPVQHQHLETVYSSQEEKRGMAIQVDQQNTHEKQFFSSIPDKHPTLPKTHANAAKHSDSCVWCQTGQCSLQRNSHSCPPCAKIASNSLSQSNEKIQNNPKGENTINFNHGYRDTTHSKIITQNINSPVHSPKIIILPYVNQKSLKNISRDLRNDHLKLNQQFIHETLTNCSKSSPKLSPELSNGNINSFNNKNSNVNISESIFQKMDAVCFRDQEQINLIKDIQKSKLNKLPELQYQKSQHPYSRIYENRNNIVQESILHKTNSIEKSSDKSITIPISFLQHHDSKQKDIKNYPLTAQLLQSQQFPLNTSKVVMNKGVHNYSGKPVLSRYRICTLKNYQEENKNCIKVNSYAQSSALEERQMRRYNESPETIVIDDDDDSNHAISTSSVTEAFFKCKHCTEEASFLCSGCKNEWYCSPNCQVAEWNQHCLVCKV